MDRLEKLCCGLEARIDAATVDLTGLPDILAIHAEFHEILATEVARMWAMTTNSTMHRAAIDAACAVVRQRIADHCLGERASAALTNYMAETAVAAFRDRLSALSTALDGIGGTA